MGIAGCADPHHGGPEAWYHESVGGKIAQERPPPPDAQEPYPNLATVPPRPTAADAGAWNRMTAGLITDRLKAREAAATAPIPPASSAPPLPAVTAPPASAPAASAALVGAAPPPVAIPTAKPASPPRAAAPPSPGPGAPTTGAPALVPPANPPPAMTSAQAAQLVATGRLPALPTREPPRPKIAPGPPPPLAPLTATPPLVAPARDGGIAIDFDRSSARLSDSALSQVKAIAAERGDGGIAIIGYGEAATSNALGQSDAAGLGLARARALATALVAQGVPYARLWLNAEAAGRGASLRLLQ